MCGIAGSIYLNTKQSTIAKEFTQKAINEILYRGPDDYNTFEKENVSLGSCRLAINDLRDIANMPMSSNCGRYTIVFNGEIYNFKYLRESLKLDFEFFTNSDTEVVLNSFIKFGPKCFDSFQGMFAVALWDNINKELTLARDRLGKKPLFFNIENDFLYFCSEINPLIKYTSKNKKINKKFIEEIALFGEQSKNLSAFQDIERIEPNRYLAIKIKDNKFETFYGNYLSLLDLKDNFCKNKSKSYLFNLLSESIQKRLISDRPIAIALSGGVDSAVLCKLISKTGMNKIPAFTVRFNKDDEEVNRAKIIARKYNLDHHIIDYKYDKNKFPQLIKKIGEPYCDPAIVYLSFICENMPKDIKVLLTGDGGDEAFLGYSKYSYSYQYSRFPSFIRNLSYLFTSNNFKSKNRFFRSIINRMDVFQVYSSSDMRDLEINLISFLKPFISEEVFTALNNIIDERSNRYYLPNKKHPLYKNYCIHDIYNRLPGRYLPKVDLAGSFNGIEIRSPYLDDVLLSKTLNNMLFGNNKLLGKPFLKEILLEDFPKSFVQNKKSGFSPNNFTLSKKQVKNALISLKSKNLSLVINELSEAFLKNPFLANHWSSKSIIWNLICIDTWYSL